MVEKTLDDLIREIIGMSYINTSEPYVNKINYKKYLGTGIGSIVGGIFGFALLIGVVDYLNQEGLDFNPYYAIVFNFGTAAMGGLLGHEISKSED